MFVQISPRGNKKRLGERFGSEEFWVELNTDKVQLHTDIFMMQNIPVLLETDLWPSTYRHHN